MAGTDPGDTGAKPRRNPKPEITETQREELKRDLKVLIDRENAGKSVDYIDEYFCEQVDAIRALVKSTGDAVNFITTASLHGLLSADLAGHLGVWVEKLAVLKDVIDIQKGSGKQAENLSPGAVDILCRALSKELVIKIDGHDYSEAEEVTGPKPAEQRLKTVDDIFNLMAKQPKPTRRTGPVLRSWGFATNYKRGIGDLLAILPDKLGKSEPEPEGKGKGTTRRNKPEPVGDGKAKRVNKPEPEGKTTRRNKPEPTTDGEGKKPTKSALVAHLEAQNGDTDVVVRDRLVKGLKGSKTVDWALAEMGIAGIPAPKA